MALNAYAADPETRVNVTSLKYVEDQLANRQDKIPAKSGDKAVTPTGVKGAIDERDIKTDLGNEATNQNDTGITTVETVNTALNDKQASIMKLPTVNVVTYTGTNNDSNATNNYYGRGVVTSTPIYDDTTNTYGNGLVRAATLNSAVQTGVNSALTQVDETGTASNTGTLWRINDLNNVLPTTAYLPAYVQGINNTLTNDCYKPYDEGLYSAYQGQCSSTLFNSLKKGDWGVLFPYETKIVYETTCGGSDSAKCGKEVQGTSVCVNIAPTVAYIAVTDPEKISALNQAVISQRNGGPTTGAYCYCKLINPSVQGAQWMYRGAFVERPCANVCAHECGYYVPRRAPLRGILFGASNPSQ